MVAREGNARARRCFTRLEMVASSTNRRAGGPPSEHPDATTASGASRTRTKDGGIRRRRVQATLHCPFYRTRAPPAGRMAPPPRSGRCGRAHRAFRAQPSLDRLPVHVAEERLDVLGLLRGLVVTHE